MRVLLSLLANKVCPFSSNLRLRVPRRLQVFAVLVLCALVARRFVVCFGVVCFGVVCFGVVCFGGMGSFTKYFLLRQIYD